MAKLNLSNLKKNESEHKTPIQEIGINGVIGDESTRTSFMTDPQLFKKFKSYLIIHDFEIKEYFELKIREIINDKNFDKNSFVDNASEERKSITISKNLLHELKIWLDKNDLKIKDILNKIMQDAVKVK